MQAFIFVEAREVEQEAVPYVRQLGYSPILFTCCKERSPELYRNINLALFDKVVDVDTHDVEAMYEIIKKDNINVSGVLACFDEMVLATAYLAKKLSLPHPNIAGLEKSFHKDNVRTILVKADVPQPRFAVIDLNSASQNAPIQFPFVVKPIRDAGTSGVYLCQSPEAYQNALAVLKNKKCTPTGMEINRIVVEDFIEGDFYGAEMLWNQNKWKILGINKIFVNAQNSLCMVGISHPADILKHELMAIEKEILTWLEILELKGGALNVEFKLVDKKPVLIEINLRLAGARINKQIQLTTGFSPIKYLISQACGNEKEIYFSNNKPKLFVADAFVFGKAANKVIQEIDTDQVDKKNLIEMKFRKLPYVIPETERNLDVALGYVLAAGRSCDEAMQNAFDIAKQIKIISHPIKIKSNQSCKRSLSFS